MALAEGVLARWRRWLLYSWSAALLVTLAGMWWNGVVAEAAPSYDFDALLGAAAMMVAAVGVYGVWIGIAWTLAMLPAALGTLLWEQRWGRSRLDADGDAYGAAIASVCLLAIALLSLPAGARAVIIAWPIFMALRALARARTASARDDTSSYARAILFVAAAQALTMAGRTVLRPGPGQILIFVPIALGAVALGLRARTPPATLPDALALRRPTARGAWLVALLPAVAILFAQLLNPAGFTYADTTPALIAVTVVAELTFRGFVFLQLRRAGARFLVAALISGLLSLAPFAVQARHELAVVIGLGLFAQAVWLAWLVERWRSTWIAIVSAVLLMIGIQSFAMLAADTRVWFTLALRLWIIGISVALTQTLQRRVPTRLAR